ncbi:MAG TPA: DinB family protein [Bryobacteraceae bacterium]
MADRRRDGVRGFDTIVVMTYYGAKDLAAAFRTVRDNTIKIAEDIGEEDYGFRATPENRSIGETLTHIANVPKMAYEIHGNRKLTTLVGFDFMGFFGPMIADEKAAHSKAEIIAALASGRDQFGSWLEGLSDEFLGQSVTVMGPNMPTKTRFEMLLGVKEHEMHHRGQLMLLERMVGVVPHLTRQMQTRIAQMQAQSQQTAQA